MTSCLATKLQKDWVELQTQWKVKAENSAHRDQEGIKRFCLAV